MSSPLLSMLSKLLSGRLSPERPTWSGMATSPTRVTCLPVFESVNVTSWLWSVRFGWQARIAAELEALTERTACALAARGEAAAREDFLGHAVRRLVLKCMLEELLPGALTTADGPQILEEAVRRMTGANTTDPVAEVFVRRSMPTSATSESRSRPLAVSMKPA